MWLRSISEEHDDDSSPPKESHCHQRQRRTGIAGIPSPSLRLQPPGGGDQKHQLPIVQVFSPGASPGTSLRSCAKTFRTDSRLSHTSREDSYHQRADCSGCSCVNTPVDVASTPGSATTCSVCSSSPSAA